MTGAGEWQLVLTAPARRALSGLPEAVATAVSLSTVHRSPGATPGGQAARGELAGIWSARRGTDRVPYRIVEQKHEIAVLRIEHQRGVYRT